MKTSNWTNILAFTLLIILVGCNPTTSDEQPDTLNVKNLDIQKDEVMAEDTVIEEEKSVFTIEDISSHNSKEDCWLIIHGEVYDVSNYDTHPGGDAIYEGCGIDSTQLFETRPMGSGTPHSQKARRFLENFYIGDLN